MSDAGTEGSTDYSHMKVNDLKKLLKTRGLPVTGNKQELLERLQSSEAAAEALLEGSEGGDAYDEELERELDESALEEDTTVKSEGDVVKEEAQDTKAVTEETNQKTNEDEKKQKPENSIELKNGVSETKKTSTEEKHVKITLKTVSLSETARKKARAERFGGGGAAAATKTTTPALATAATTAATPGTTTPIVISNDTLKRRAERFGILSPVEIKRQHLEKLQARKLRFQQQPTAADLKTGTVTTTTTPATGGDTEKKATIASVPTNISLEERKRLRAQRFKITA